MRFGTRQLTVITAFGLTVGGAAYCMAQTAASPATPASLIANARPGQTIVLPSGNGGTLSIVNRTFSPAITIDASRAILSGIVIRGSSGIIVNNGSIVGPGGRSYGINIDRSTQVTIANMTITGAHRGIVMGRSRNVSIVNNQLTNLISDGIDIALSQRVLIQGNSCQGFAPVASTYTADGTRVEDGDHPDCIQAWSRPDGLPTSDVRIIGNRARGRMQGIFFGNHVRNGVDDGGFDRIVIEGNTIVVSSLNAITLYAARGSRVTANEIVSVPGATYPRPPYSPIRSTLRIVDSPGIVSCRNRVDGQAASADAGRCPVTGAL